MTFIFFYSEHCQSAEAIIDFLMGFEKRNKLLVPLVSHTRFLFPVVEFPVQI